MDKGILREVILNQQDFFLLKENLINREINLRKYIESKEIVIITGIRRCGKSSLLKIISKLIKKSFIYINFDDIKFSDFNINNFQDIEDIVAEIYGDEEIVYFLDEMQNIPMWQRWVNNLYSRKIKVFVTGSNSNLLSSEISTYLTGRNRVIKLYPFSFREFLDFKKVPKLFRTSKERNKIFNAFKKYFTRGGFPLVIEGNDMELSKSYFEDIFNKDIINRYKIKKIKEYKELILYLFSNVSRIYSYSTLQRVTGIKSLSMIKNYIDYLKGVFLAYNVSKFDYSIKKQSVSSSKFYVGDNSFLKTVAFNFSENIGYRLENLVFLELLRKNYDIYYYLGKQECDFLIKKGLKITKAIQVSYKLDDKILREREINGLIEAMKSYQLKEGLILTMENEEEFKINGKKIIIKPIWKWLLEGEI